MIEPAASTGENVGSQFLSLQRLAAHNFGERSAPYGAGSRRIFKTYGADAVQVMSENPYRRARDIRGIGFNTADAIAMKLGIEKTAMVRVRVRAGISFALTEAMDDGHCGLPTDELLSLAGSCLKCRWNWPLDLGLADGTVVADTVGETACIFLAGLHRVERKVADRLRGLSSGSLPWPWIDPDKALPWVAERLKLTFADSQTAAIRQALACKVLVITGGPGVGKTTIVKAILRILTQLDHASLVSAQLQGADFTYAELQGASLIQARLQGAFLDHAKLQNADLVGAQLQAASLEEGGSLAP
jgi:hypothetical protein